MGRTDMQANQARLGSSMLFATWVVGLQRSINFISGPTRALLLCGLRIKRSFFFIFSLKLLRIIKKNIKHMSGPGPDPQEAGAWLAVS